MELQVATDLFRCVPCEQIRGQSSLHKGGQSAGSHFAVDTVEGASATWSVWLTVRTTDALADWQVGVLASAGWQLDTLASATFFAHTFAHWAATSLLPDFFTTSCAETVVAVNRNPASIIVKQINFRITFDLYSPRSAELPGTLEFTGQGISNGRAELLHTRYKLVKHLLNGSTGAGI
jgi:hypothetical protein